MVAHYESAYTCWPWDCLWGPSPPIWAEIKRPPGLRVNVLFSKSVLDAAGVFRYVS